MFESFFKKIKKIDARDEKKDLVYDSVSGIIFKKSLTQRIQNSKHVKFVSKHSLFLAIGILLLIAIVQFTPFNSSSFASTTRFYSSSCLGGWQNTNHVQGEPDAPQLETGPGFSSQNSAILTDAVSTLFCGGFSGNIPKDSKPKKVIVSFSWGTTPLESTSNASSSSVIDGSATSSSLQLLDTPASEHPTVLSGNATSSDQTSSEDKPKENSSSDSTPSSDTNSSGSTPKPSETSSPSSAPASEPTPTSAPAPTPNEPTPASAPAASEPAPAPAPSPAPEAFNNLLISHVFADEISSSTSGGFLKVSYTDNGKDWHELGVVNRNNLNNVSFEIPQNVVSQWSDVNKIQVSVESLPTVDSQPTVYLDSMWLEVEYDRIATISDAEIKYLPRVEVGDTNIFDQTQKDFQSNENPEFEINLENESASSTNSLTNSSTNQNVQSSSDTGSSTVSTSTPVSFIGKLQNLLTYFAPSKVFAQDFSKKKVLKAELFSPDGTLYKDQPIIEEQNGKAIVTVPHHSKSFRPGKYQLRIEVLSDNKVLTTTRDFGWGVLAINTDKSSYEKKDDVYLQIGALTSEGHTMCNASLELVVTNPKGKTAIFSTADETIKKSVTCAKDNVTDNPDYFLHYKTTVTGVYSMTLKNKDNGFEVSDTFEVNPQARFVVERIGATRINPFASDYVMNIKVTATEDFDGTINELIPTDFDILSTTPSADVVDVSEGKKISWTKHIAAGETINLSYDYRAAQISPELFLLGPITFETTNGTVGQEPRAWQLASDAACNAITTGNWNDGTKFSGCTGTAGVPAAADTVTINSGVIMTITADATTSAITVAANASGVTGNGITINSGINFAVTGAITMTAPTALTSDITVGAGTLYAASITIPGSATGGRFASISVSTGNIGVTGAITFSGVSTQARYISTGASTLTIGGNFGSGGTLTTSSTGTMVFNGGSAQTMGIYATYNNIQIANTSGGVSILGAVTLLGTLTINTGGLTFGGFTTTVTGVTTINNGGTLTLSSATGAKTFTGAVTINVGGTWTESATAIPTFSNGLTNNGTLTAAGGVHTFSTNSQTIGGSSAISIASITVTGAGISLTNNATTSGLTIATALSGTGWFIQGPGSIVNLGGTFAITTFSATSTTNVVNFNSASAQTIPTITYTTLKINNTNASGATLAGAITLTTLTIGDVAASSLFADAGFTITPSGSSVLNLTQGTYKLGTVLIGNTMPAYATMNISSGSTVQYASSAATQTISSTPNYQNITFTGTSTKTANGNLSVGGNFTVNATSQTVNLSSFTHSIVGNIVITLGTLDASTSVTTLQGNLSGAGTFTGNASTLNLTGSNTQTLGATSQIFNNMSVSKNATSTTASFTTAATVNGTFTVGTATFSIGGFATVFNSTVTISGVLNITSATGAKIFPTVILNTGSTWNNSGNSTVTFRGSGITYNGSSFTSGSGVQTFDTNAQTVSGSSAFTITNMTVTGAGISVTNTNTGGLTITTALAGTGWFIQGTNGSVILPGTFAITTFSATSTGNTVNYSGATQTAKPINYYNLTLSGSGNKTLTTVATISGDFVTSGTVVATSTSLTSIGSRLIIGSGTTYTNNNPMTVSSTTLISGTIIRTALGTGTIFTGLVTVDSTGIWTTIASATGKFRGGIQNDGSFVTGPAVSVSFVFDTNAQTISGSSPISIGDVTLDKDITNNNTAGLTISSLFGSTTATTNFTQGTNALLYIRGTVSTLSGVVINASATGNTVDYMATTAQTAKSATYYTLNINNTNASGVQLGGAVTTTNLNIGNATSSSIFDDGGFVITPSGTTSFYLGTSSSYKIGSASVATTFPTFNTTTIVVGGSPSTVIYQSAVNQTISTSPTYANLTINGSSTKILSDTATTTIQNNLVLNAGTLHFCDTGVSCVVAIGANGIVGIATGTYINGGGTINSASGNISAAGTGSFSNTGLVRITGNTAGSNFSPNGGTMNQINIEKTAGVLTYFASSTTVATLNVISGLLTFDTGTTTVTGVTTISDSFDIDNATGAKTFGGAVVINSGATWTNTGATSAIFQGGLTFNGSSFSSGSGTYTFNTNSQSIGGSTAFTIQNIAVTGVTLTNNSTVGLTVSNLLSGTGGLTQAASSVLTISSSTSITTLTASASLNTVNYTATLAQTIKAATYYDISLTGGTKTISSGTTVNNNLSLSTNAVATTAGNMTIGNSLAISTSSTLTTGSNFTLNVGGATVVSGVLANAGTALKTYTGSVGINGGGSFTSANNGNITLRGGFTNNAAGGSVSFGTGTITFDTNDQSVSGTNPVSIENITVTGITLSNLTSTFLNASSSLSGTGTLYQGTSTVLLINGSSGITTLLASTSPNTVVYASTTAAQTVKSSTYNALKIDKTSQTATLGGAITVNANLSILAGTLDTSSGNNYAITVKGDWINTGTFTPRSGTVTFNSASTQTINNTNNWFGLAITGTTAARTVYFESSATQNIATSGVLTLTGGALKLLTLAPLTAATPWNLHVVNSGVTQTISYVSVSYSDASPFTYAQITAGDGTNTDGTNNTNWSFTNVTTISFSLSANTIGFGNLSSSLARFATNDSLGSASEVEAHQVVAATNAPSGYNLAIQGSTLNCGANTITSIGGTNTASSVGTEQFGIRATATGGSGTVTSPYAASGFAYAGTATTTSQIGSSVVPTATTTYSIRYLANITANTEACNYSSVLNFILTPNF